MVCDVDEVVLHFVEPLRQLLAENGLRLGDGAFRLHGNVTNRRGERVGHDVVTGHLERLLLEQERRQYPVDGAAEALATLAAEATVILLTTVPHAHRDARVRTLASHGIGFPIVTNEGSKGAAIASISHPGPIAFIDDLPFNHRDVREHAPAAACIQFIADPVMRAVVPPLPPGVAATESWPEVVDGVRAAFAASAHRL